jgi:hypothetical protein
MPQDDRLYEFNRRGFTTFPAVLSADETCGIRGIGERIHNSTKLEWINYDAIYQIPELRRLPFRPECVRAMKTLFGNEFYVVPDFAMNMNRYGTWHRDTGSQIGDGVEYLHDPDFLHVTFGLYLQANDPVFGGGLDVVPGSHRCILPGLVGWQVPRLEAVRDKIRVKLGAAYSIPCNPGDLVAFNFWIYHQATPAKRERPATAPLRMAAFWGATRKRDHAEAYVEHLRRRAANEPHYALLFSNGQFSYPADVRQIAKDNGCRLIPG